MYTRISDSRSCPRALPARGGLAALLLLAACKPALPDKPADAKRAAQSEAYAEAEGKIACAPVGSDTFTRSCTVDRVQSQDGMFLTLRQPEGGFHRLLVTKDGRGVVAADGAERAVVTVLGPDVIEVALGGARYRLPATVKGSEARR
ncbi:hypothetical protein [Sphingomonas sp. S2-65]|uniref:hypothetical protein n=1 Tax=Sphingomonas sp. S2-65 TaxID=2903960 RepID=UPI001F26796B|nr:hypothetical protein [Sphingomonas sp. S2-65]UYY59127.1 hypothetical protein LZ586_03235 [Sphingomonas sp. S2-65]